MRWLLPELDMLGLRMTLKGVQMVETEITLIFWGLHPDSCPEGFKSIMIRVFNLEADAMVSRGELSKIDRGTLNFTDLFFKSSGIKSFKLDNPADKAKYGTDQFLDTLGRGMVLETQSGRTAAHKTFIDASVNSGNIKKYGGARITPSLIPQGNIAASAARKFMQMKRAHMALVFHSDTVYLPGIVDPFHDVRVAYQEGRQASSPYQHKTASLFRVMGKIETDCGQPLFYAMCPTLTGPNAGSLFCTSYKKDPILALRRKLEPSPVAWLWWYCYAVLGFTGPCIDRLMRGCDTEEVLLIPETEWDEATWTVTTPFEDDAEEFLRGIERDQIVLDMSAMRPPDEDDDLSTPAPDRDANNNTSPTVNDVEAEMARRLGLKDDATFTSQATGHVSRVTGATANTNGANTFRTTDTAGAKRSFREKCLEIARARQAKIQEVNSATDPQSGSEESTKDSQGVPASNGSATATPDKPSVADLPEATKGGGAST